MKINLFKLIETADEVWVDNLPVDECGLLEAYEACPTLFRLTTNDDWDYHFGDQEVELDDGNCWAREYDVASCLVIGPPRQLTFYVSRLLQPEDFQ